MATARSSRALRTMPLLIAVCFAGIDARAQYGGGTTASAGTNTYFFLPDQSAVVQTGGIAGVHWTYSVEGRFQLTVDPDAGTASFAHVEAKATDDSPLRRTLDPNQVFNMTSLLGTVLDDATISFAGQATDGSDVLIAVTIQDDLAYLVGETIPPPDTADFFLFSLDAVAQRKYGGGSGAAEDPYLIYTAEQMNEIGLHEEDWDKHFKLMADIDLSNYRGTEFNIIGIDLDHPFTGAFDGNGHAVSNFTYTSTGTDNIGLFGYVGWKAVIEDLGLINPNVDAGRACAAGPLAGSLVQGTTSNCYVEGGSVLGQQWIGGLVGDNTGTITHCYSTATVSGSWSIGGLVGACSWPSSITNCYSAGGVSGEVGVGGLVGGNLDTITNCYASGSVSGDSEVGGLVGDNGGTVANCYSIGSVSGRESVGGLVGLNSWTIRDSFWDIQISGQSTSAGGTGKTTAQMQMESTFTDAGWDFVGETANGTEDIWSILEGRDYPRLWWGDKPDESPDIPSLSDFLTGAGTHNQPYLIYTAEQMNLIGLCKEDWDKHFKLMTDIDLSNYTGTDFNIIGIDFDNSFTGVFDGNGHTITNFSYTSTDRDHVGLFGYVGKWGKDAHIKDLGVIDPHVDAGSRTDVGSLVGYLTEATITNCYAQGGQVSGGWTVGGLVGSNWDGAVMSCYSTASVSSSHWDAGGLVGNNFGGAITNCYSRGNVFGGSQVGGLVGSNSFGTITNCYSTGNVADDDGFGTWVGGLVGEGMVGEVTDSFWNIETSGQATSAGGTGKTTAQMRTASTFLESGWDFMGEIDNGTEDVWWIFEGQDYPRLWWEREPGEEPDVPPLSDFLTGTGTEDDPYLIYTAEQMNVIGLYEQDWGKHFKLMADIDLSRCTGTDFNVIGYAVGLDSPDNRPFSGVFDGNGHTISNFTYTCTGRGNMGLFGYIEDPDAEIRDLGLIDPNIDAGTEGRGIGSLAGDLREGTITGCYAQGGRVSGHETVGGLVGSSFEGRLANCYSNVSVLGNEKVGGLAGDNAGTMTNCYSRGSVSGGSQVGGLVGFNLGTITACYSVGRVEGTADVGGLVGRGGGTTASFWDIETSGQPGSNGGTGKTTAEMRMKSTFADAGWDLVDTWKVFEGLDYPRLWWEKYGGGTGGPNDPYLICTAEQMNEIGLHEEDWDKHFKLIADIDLSGYTGTDFNIIGGFVELDSPDNEPFRGVFDANGHTISNFTHTSTGRVHVGLFGWVDDPNAEIKNLGLIDPHVDAGPEGCAVGSLVGDLGEGTITACYVEGGSMSGSSHVGGLVGRSLEGRITNCCSNVSVLGNVNVGGLAGSNGAIISNCYSTGSISGSECVGGLVGFNLGTITTCYSAGHVEGAADVGGLVGWGGAAIASFWDIETSGQLTSSGGIDKTTAQMQTASTFVGWSFGPVWTIDEARDYPRLRWENKPGEAPETPQLSDFLTGAGTPSDPYLIYTAEELNAIGLFPNDWHKHFKLMADIDLAGFTGTDFNVIGISHDSAFTGVFDGNGQKISNFTYTSTRVANIGLFAYVRGASAQIKDLGLIDPNVHTGTGSWGVGPLVGWLEDGAVTGCYVEGGNVSGDEDVGGLVGSSQGTITDCYAVGIISCNSGGGGLAGNNMGGAITNCYSAASVSGSDWLGGLVGSSGLLGTITTCYSICDVEGTAYVGGLVGQNFWSEITNSYADGSVLGNELVGGLVGENADGTITNCYSTGSVSANELAGGLVGEDSAFVGSGTISNSFWDIETSGQTTSVGGTGKTTAQMQTPSTFTDAGWDFVGETANGTEDLWWILEGQDYPRLWWESIPEN